MRLSTDADRDEARAHATIAAAAGAGVTVFDTAHSYGRDDAERGHNERLLASALRACGAAATARVITKGGMARPAGAWVPDGRAGTIRADCEASIAALDGLPIDLYLLHAPDPRTPWRTSVRALGRLLDEGAVRRVGLSNVSRGQLDEALLILPVAAVSLAWSPFDDGALRGGVPERCAERGIAVIAHAPLGGPRRAGRLARSDVLAHLAAAHDVAPAEVALAGLLARHPGLVAVPGARRPETARSAARAARIVLGGGDREALAGAFAGLRPPRPAGRRARTGAEVVVVMGIPGAGKSRVAAGYVARGHVRLNRDERGGSLRELAAALDIALAAGAGSVVLDNTYLTRAARSHVVEAAAGHGLPVRCVWLDTPLAQAQVNLVARLIARAGSLPSPEELRALGRREPGMLTPTAQMRAVRMLEPPAADEGFAAVERVAFARAAPVGARPGVFVAAAAVGRPGFEDAIAQDGASAPHLVFDWHPDGRGDVVEAARDVLAGLVAGPVEGALCPHAGGPPRCWCRPPLPGLVLAFAAARGVDPARSLLVGTGPAHRTLAAALGARYAGV